MSLIKFNKNGSLLDCMLELEGHRVRIISETPVIGIRQLIEEGFVELNEHSKIEMVDFSDKRYVYHEEEKDHVFVITSEEDDVWEPQPFIPPAPVPPAPEPPEPPLDEVKAQKIAELQTASESAIASGVTVTLSDGTSGVYTFNERDQLSLIVWRMEAEKAEDKDTPSIPWHSGDEMEQVSYYSPTDILLITDAVIRSATYHMTLFRDMRIYVKSLRNKNDVNAVSYDISTLPEAYWSQVLRDIVAEISA